MILTLRGAEGSFLPEIAAVEAGSRAVTQSCCGWLGGVPDSLEFSWHSGVLGA